MSEEVDDVDFLSRLGYVTVRCGCGDAVRNQVEIDIPAQTLSRPSLDIHHIEDA